MSRHEEIVADFEQVLEELNERDFNKPHHHETLDQAVRLVESVVQAVDEGD
jgi:hypothetical protein